MGSGHFGHGGERAIRRWSACGKLRGYSIATLAQASRLWAAANVIGVDVFPTRQANSRDTTGDILCAQWDVPGGLSAMEISAREFWRTWTASLGHGWLTRPCQSLSVRLSLLGLCSP